MDEGKREIIALFSVSPRGTGESSLGIVNVFFFPMAWCTLYFKRCVCDDYEQDALKSGCMHGCFYGALAHLQVFTVSLTNSVHL